MKHSSPLSILFPLAMFAALWLAPALGMAANADPNATKEAIANAANTAGEAVKSKAMQIQNEISSQTAHGPGGAGTPPGAQFSSPAPQSGAPAGQGGAKPGARPGAKTGAGQRSTTPIYGDIIIYK
ncbi:MAG: hypothetical protein AUJ49_10150 [Desulfovibrionaceae bacterium CG1_02_65_16]|nr:MAG: hypothetical protein AUJ49_10150 [Desulfovibrionaceae bacterium CG1_02_65_16]